MGFDWENADQVFAKIDEEIGELKSAMRDKDESDIEEEIGDLLFAVVNLSRKVGVEPENALKKTNYKFRQRFRFIEDQLESERKTFEEVSLDEMDSLWNKAKGQGGG